MFTVRVVAVATVLALYGWLLAPQLSKPFVYDDVNFALGGQAVAETGLPFGNQGYLVHLYWLREQWALWHPPLYIFGLGLTFALFGTSEVTARGLGIVCQLAAAGFVFDLARRLTPADLRARTFAGVAATALFLLCPLTVQSALVLDIDNTVLMLLLTVYVWVALRLPNRWPPRTVLALALLYTVTLWAKLTTPLVLVAALVFVRLFSRPGWRGALEALAVGALGWTMFIVSWFLVTGLTGIPNDYTFEVVYREAIESGASTRDRLVSVPAFVNGAAPAILWIGPFFALFFVATGIPRLWSLVRGRGLAPVDLVVVLGAAVYLVYIMKLAGGFPKYHAAMLPLWAAATGALAGRSLVHAGRRQLGLIAVGSAGVGIWFALWMPNVWGTELTQPLVLHLLAIPLVAGLFLVALWRLAGKGGPLSGLPVTLFGLVLAWSVALNVHQRALPGSTSYFYGRDGQIAAARALSERLGPDELYVASKEIAWYSAQRQYVDQDSWQHWVWAEKSGRFDGTWLGLAEIRLLALETEHPLVREAIEGVLVPRYRSVGQFGSFTLYERVS